MMEFNFDIKGGDFSKVGTASDEVKRILRQLNFSPSLIKKMTIAMYEAEVNIIAYAYHGFMKLIINAEKIVLQLDDEGPGIPDIEKAMQKGFSTASEEIRQMGFGAGMGLQNIKKNSDNMTIESLVGVGTRLTITNFIK